MDLKHIGCLSPEGSSAECEISWQGEQSSVFFFILNSKTL
jgi:hypothetical protein